jgi:hypothetical protein
MSSVKTLLGSTALASGVTGGLPVRGPRQSTWTPAPSSPQSNARHLVANDVGVQRSVPPQLTWLCVDDKLFETRTELDNYLTSPHFAFMTSSLARGYLPDYRPMCARGELMNVLEAMEPLVASAELRGALAARVQEQSLGRLGLVSATAADFGGNLGENVVYLALRRSGHRIPFALTSTGFEQHRRVA